MRSLTPPPYLTALADQTRRGLALTALVALVALVALGAGSARAASVFVIRGGGNGHGIGMSQYGAYGYALHGDDYRTILARYYQGTRLGSTDPGQIVRVLVATGQAAVAGATSAAGGGATLTLDPSTTYTVTPAAAGALKLTAVGSKPRKKAKPQTLSAPVTFSGPAPLQLAGVGTYRGSLVLSPDGHGDVQTVDAVGLDDYVRGVVAAEMPSGWATAALQAQAVAARTYAITTTVSGNGYDLYSDTRSQMYGGVDSETAATDAAVAATSGQIVTYDGRPAVTYFFSSSGGHTESIQDVWPGATPDPWLQGVPDPYDSAGQDPYHSWAAQMSVATAAQKLHGLVRGRLLGIRIIRHGSSPRIIEAVVVGTGGRRTVSGPQLQSRFGLQTTLAAFTTIACRVAGRQLVGSIFPAPRSGSVSLQSAAGGWHTIGSATLTAAGRYAALLPGGPGRYRIVFGQVDGPTVTAR